MFYSQAIQRLTECKKSKAFAEWIDDTLKRVVLPKGKVVDLPSLLITPVQRITRYSLLFMVLPLPCRVLSGFCSPVCFHVAAVGEKC